MWPIQQHQAKRSCHIAATAQGPDIAKSDLRFTLLIDPSQPMCASAPSMLLYSLRGSNRGYNSSQRKGCCRGQFSSCHHVNHIIDVVKHLGSKNSWVNSNSVTLAQHFIAELFLQVSPRHCLECSEKVLHGSGRIKIKWQIVLDTPRLATTSHYCTYILSKLMQSMSCMASVCSAVVSAQQVDSFWGCTLFRPFLLLTDPVMNKGTNAEQTRD